MRNIFFYMSALFLSGSAQSNTQVLNDNSTLNATHVADFVQPESMNDLKKILERARTQHCTIALAGKRHSQGGQSLCKDGIVVDINKLNAIMALDTAHNTITVQPGVTWEQIQEHINPYGLSIKVMQASNIFTVGGSLSVNVHGRDPHYGPLIDTIQSCQVLLTTGALVTASRTENPALFNHVIGGYGLFGMVTEVTLSLTQNVIYQKQAQIVAIKDYAHFFNTKIKPNKTIGLHFGRIIVHNPLNTKWDRINAVSYHEVTDTKKYAQDIWDLQPEKHIARNKKLLNALRKNNIAKAARVPIELAYENNREYISRNNAMRPPIACLEYNSPHDTDVLQEYFVPCAQLARFTRKMQAILEHYKVNILNITIRFVPQSTESALSYAQHDCFALVLYVNHKKDQRSITRAQRWTQKLIDAALSCNGSYYLPYSLYASDQQIRLAYPQLDAFFEQKRIWDPEEILSNTFYTRYKTCNF